jgi:hypothetical protein
LRSSSAGFKAAGRQRWQPRSAAPDNSGENQRRRVAFGPCEPKTRKAYPAVGPGANDGPAAGSRAPDLDLRGAPAATVFGLLRAARFVLLSLDGEGARDRCVLIRPDGHIAWAALRR